MDERRMDEHRGADTVTDYETITVDIQGRVGVITLNRPAVLNALNATLAEEVAAVAAELDADDGIGAIVLTGSPRAFAAGADIGEMATKEYHDLARHGLFDAWTRFAALRTPTIAAVAGFALGGGCELAMMCDLIIAADTAKFGQPEINLGVMPGLGGTQRLTRAVGKAKAMDMVLTGRTIDAEEAERAGLVARVVPADDLLPTAMQVAETIASKSLPVVYAAKEAVDVAFETTLEQGLLFERRGFAALFALHDQKEGMAAFLQKRPPRFENR
jgi:enoyl-CoA hydratase